MAEESIYKKTAEHVHLKQKEALDDDLKQALSDNPYICGVPELVQIQLIRSLNRLNKNLEAAILKL